MRFNYVLFSSHVVCVTAFAGSVEVATSRCHFSALGPVVDIDFDLANSFRYLFFQALCEFEVLYFR